MNYRARVSGGVSAAVSANASTLVFVAFLTAGVAYIIASKSLGVSALWATVVPLVIISGYAVILLLARYLRLRDDQSGDNLYYLGFLYTLTSLGVSLWQFSTAGGAEVVVTNFGVAVSSTILGVALRVIFNQMRQDPLEVERSARLELADAARRVRQELDATVFELSGFRRATQQSLSDGTIEVKNQIEAVSGVVIAALKELPERAAGPVEGVSKQTAEALVKLSAALTAGLEQSTSAINVAASDLASTAAAITDALKSIESRLKSMQMPDGIIELKLQPTIRSMTKALKDLSETLGSQVVELQSAVHGATTATKEASRTYEVALAVQNKNTERIVSLVSSTQESFRRLSDGLIAAQAQQRQRDSEVTAVLAKLAELAARSHASASFVHWPWSRR